MKLSEFKELTESIKNSGVIIFYAVLGFVLLTKVLPRIDWKNLKLESVEYGGLKWATASNEVNTKARTEGKQPSDMKVDIAIVPIATYLDTALRKSVSYYWVYIGQYEYKQGKKTWLTKNFSLIDTLSIKQITALTDVYKRDGLPFQIGGNDDWKLGSIIGLVNKGKTLTIVRDTTIQDQNTWALIRE